MWPRGCGLGQNVQVLTCTLIQDLNAMFPASILLTLLSGQDSSGGRKGGKEGEMVTQTLAHSGGKGLSLCHSLNYSHSCLPLMVVITVATQVQSFFVLHLLQTIFGSPNYLPQPETLVSGA